MCEGVKKNYQLIEKERGRKRENKGIGGTGYLAESEAWSITTTCWTEKKEIKVTHSKKRVRSEKRKWKLRKGVCSIDTRNNNHNNQKCEEEECD